MNLTQELIIDLHTHSSGFAQFQFQKIKNKFITIQVVEVFLVLSEIELVLWDFPFVELITLLARKTPGSALREMVTRSSLSIPSAEGTLNETIGPSWNLSLIPVQWKKGKSWSAFLTNSCVIFGLFSIKVLWSKIAPRRWWSTEKYPSKSSVEEALGCSGGKHLVWHSDLRNSMLSIFATRATITSPFMPLIFLIGLKFIWKKTFCNDWKHFQLQCNYCLSCWTRCFLKNSYLFTSMVE